MEIALIVVAAALGGFIFYVGVQVGYKLSQKVEPKVEPVKAVASAVHTIAPKKAAEPDAWEVGMKSILNYDGIKE